MQSGKGEVKASSRADDVILYTGIHNNTKTLLKLIYTFSKVTEYQINMQKNQLPLLYTNDKYSGKRNRGNNLPHISHKK